jgi:hypothetical protein
MGIWMYLVLAVAALVVFNILLVVLLSRANPGERFALSDEQRLKSR